MEQPRHKPQPPELDDALRAWILVRARAINGKLLARLATVSDDLDAGRYLGALGGLEGCEREITTLRNFLLLIP
jgi:hypothetical protein